MPEKSSPLSGTSVTTPLSKEHQNTPTGSHGVVPSLRYSWEFAKTDLRRGYRWVKTQNFWLIFTVIMGVIGAFLLWRTFQAARDVGSALATGAPIPAWIVTATGIIWLFMTLLLAGDGAGSNGDLDNDGQYLTIRPTADIVGGKLIAAATKFSIYTIGLGLVAGAGLAVGTGSVLPFFGMLVAGVVVVSTAAAIGYPIGFALKGIIRRSRNLGRMTSIVVVVLAFAYVTLSVTGELLTVVDSLTPVLQAPPLAWFGQLALATTPQAGIDMGGVFVLLVLVPIVIIGGMRLSVITARYAWLADGPQRSSSNESGIPTAPDHRIDGVLGLLGRAPATRGIATTTLLRAVRSPLQFVFVAPPLLAGIAFVEGAVTRGTVPWYVPWFVVWYGAWAAGAVIPLNPLGNQGATLSTLLTTPADGHNVVHGHVIAAALVTAPLTAGLAIGAGILAGSSSVTLVLLGIFGVAAVVGSAIVATAIGSVFPRFEAIRFDASRQAVPPSKRAYSLFSLYLSLAVTVIALVSDETVRVAGAVLLTQLLPWGIEVSPNTVTIVSWIGLVGCVLMVPIAYRIAIRRIDSYALE